MSMSPAFEIYGTGTVNRGAELMAIAIAERLRAFFPKVRIVVPPNFGSYVARAKHGFWTTWEIRGRILGRLRSLVLRAAATANWELIGVLEPREIAAVLDASGFAFSDQWGPGPAQRLLIHVNGSARSGKPLVLLPQAFGPFQQPETAGAMRALAGRASLICARDQESLGHLLALGIPSDRVRVYPDFTAGIGAVMTNDLPLPDTFVAVVPNIQFFYRTDRGENYLQVLRGAVNALARQGMALVFVIHGGSKDAELAHLLGGDTCSRPIVEHPDPRVLKGVLARARFVVGSRYHALVSALSQGVPCVGIGWAHKYRHLFADFDCPELLVTDWITPGRVEEVARGLCDEAAKVYWHKRITQAAEKVRNATETMWQEVLKVIKAAGQ